MDQLDEFRRHQRRQGGTCTFPAAEASLKPADRRKLATAMAAPDITNAAIARWLQAHGQDIKANTVGRHRKKECSCDQS